jgi:hypothetical protein
MKMKLSDWIAEAGLDAPPCAPVDPAITERIREQTMQQIQTGHKGKKFRVLLAVAATVAALSITAAAAYVAVHANNRDLMAASPLTGGSQPQVIDETSAAVIDEAANDLALSCTDSGSTVTLDSVMGFATDDLSVVYLSLTMDYPDGTTFSCDASELGFRSWFLRPTDGEMGNGSGSQVTVANDDGTCSVMLMFEFDSNLSGKTATLELEQFGNMSGENLEAIGEGAAQAEVSGAWNFTLGLPLGQPDEVAFDAALFDDAAFMPTSIALSEFGGCVTLADDRTALSQVTLEFEDGSTYDGEFRSFANGSDETGEFHFTNGFVFEAPQDLTHAVALILDGVRVPLG